VKAFYKDCDSFVIAQREFWREFGIHHNRAVPSGHAIRTWVRNFEATGLTLKKKGGSVKSVECWLQAARVTQTGDGQNSMHSFSGLSHYRNVLGCTYGFYAPTFFSVEPVASNFRTQVMMAWADGTARLRWIMNSSKFTLSNHRTVTICVERLHSKSTLWSSPRLHCNQNALKLAAKWR
jgi:hypothetical protein